MEILILITLIAVTPLLIFLFKITENEDMTLKITKGSILITPMSKLILSLGLTTVIGLTLTEHATPTHLLIFTLIIMAGYDLRFKLVPDELTIVILVLATYYISQNMYLQIYIDHLTTSLVTFTILYAIAHYTKGGIGGADIKLFTALGLLFGYQYTILIFILTYLIGALVELPKYAITKNKEVALVPYIAVATYITVIAGERIITWYIDGGLTILFNWR